MNNDFSRKEWSSTSVSYMGILLLFSVYKKQDLLKMMILYYKLMPFVCKNPWLYILYVETLVANKNW